MSTKHSNLYKASQPYIMDGFTSSIVVLQCLYMKSSERERAGVRKKTISAEHVLIITRMVSCKIELDL